MDVTPLWRVAHGQVYSSALRPLPRKPLSGWRLPVPRRDSRSPFDRNSSDLQCTRSPKWESSEWAPERAGFIARRLVSAPGALVQECQQRIGGAFLIA